MVRPSSCVPAGISDRSPAADSADEGPASSWSSAARPTPTVAGTPRWVLNSFPCLVNQACRLTWPAALRGDVAVGVGAGDWSPPAGCVVPAGAAGLAALADPVGTGPSLPAPLVPHAASNPTLTIKMGRRFMVGLLTHRLCVSTMLRRASRRLTGTSPFAHIAGWVIGRVRQNTDPRRTSLDTLMSPPRSRAFSSAIARPSPLPALARAESAL